jgi:YVTN family beta-propeller protein
MSNKFRAAFLILAACAALAVCAWSLAQTPVPNQPASPGRPITPVGELVLDANTRQPAVGSLPVNFVRSPDTTGPGGAGRYLIAVNSGYGIQFSAATNWAQQSLAVIDLNAAPPAVVQNVYFPTPQSAHVGAVFAPQEQDDGSFTLYVSGGYENKIWVFRLRPGAREPLAPASRGPATQVAAPSISVAGFAVAATTPRFHGNREPVYPTGLALSPDSETLFVANMQSDNLGIVRDLRGARWLERVDLRARPDENVYPYAALAIPAADGKSAAKVYVSCWATATVAVVNPAPPAALVKRVGVGRHPTAMIRNAAGTRVFVANSNGDSVSVIDTASDAEIERINVRLAETERLGASPQGLALSADEKILYVANAHANVVAVVTLAAESRGASSEEEEESASSAAKEEDDEVAASSKEDEQEEEDEEETDDRSKVLGYIPTGSYPSAVALTGGTLFIGNGKGTGVENSSVVVNNSGRFPNAPNDRFPAGGGRAGGSGGQYSVSLVSGNISAVPLPDEVTLARWTQQAMRNNGLLGEQKSQLFRGPSPIKHVIYIIRENRTYDQVFGDVSRAGNGQPADGDPRLAIFGAGDAARLPGGPPQNITPNARALALRFGLLDRFFVNSEASPDGHNWSTAAFSSDYVDKMFRWTYSSRGRAYDFEGFNRLPAHWPIAGEPPLLTTPVTAEDIANFMKRYVPYLRGGRDVAEPETLYLWDASARAKLTYRNYGEFIGTISGADVDAFNANRPKRYPDLSPTLTAFATKRSLEGHFSPTYRNYDLETPDALTTDCYSALRAGKISPPYQSPDHSEARCRGYSRIADWLAEFRGYVANLNAGQGDRLPNFSMVRLPNDHTAGMGTGMPTPQFMVAENDFALGLLVEAVSSSPYWKDTAIFVVEDDAQDGPDHVDAHRSVALVISAYNRPGALVHEFHSTVSLIRTMELLLGMEPMNQLDATAAPIDIFQDAPDLKPFKALLPDVAANNLMNPPRNPTTAQWIDLTEQQNLAHADMANPRVLNEIIWFSVRGESEPMPQIARLPAFDALRAGLAGEAEGQLDAIKRMRNILAWFHVPPSKRKNGESRK